MSSFLDISNLDLSYNQGESYVLKSVNASLKKGQLTALIGKNGSGKSTLINAIANQTSIAAGSIRIGGKEAAQIDIQEKSKALSIVRTFLPDLGYMTVEEFVALGRYPYTNWSGKLDDKNISKVEGVLKDMQISHMKSKYLFELSDGERQKTIIARSLAQDTSLILMDEPTAFIDPVASLEILDLLKSQCVENHKAILFSSHDIGSTFIYADQIWLIDENNHLHRGKPMELINNGQVEKAFGKEGYQLVQSIIGFQPI
ncbi:MAG: iron complex transport system ATP-binding protein [Patiriisocius sp.]|jgi:iron complex transport system ATP-binding protein